MYVYITIPNVKYSLAGYIYIFLTYPDIYFFQFNKYLNNNKSSFLS